jgi:hypothetical protein
MASVKDLAQLSLRRVCVAVITARRPKTIIIHINGNLADLDGTAPTKPGLNQSHVIFEVEVRWPPVSNRND